MPHTERGHCVTNIEMKGSDSIRQLKEKIALVGRSSRPVDQQRIIYYGKIDLTDEKLIGDLRTEGSLAAIPVDAIQVSLDWRRSLNERTIMDFSSLAYDCII